MLEKSWDGFAVHTEAGYNVGKPPYGYRAKPVPHPVPAKRAKGHKKTRLEPDPIQASVVQKIFRWRWEENLSHQAIADRLNLDLTTHPAPVPVDPNTAVGRWTWSNVAGVLSNPKYTGHQVWNRRGRKSNKNQANPVAEWVWSKESVHEPLVDLDLFIAVQERGKTRDNSRRGAGANSHPHTKRSYRYRSHLYCDLCNRRMFGKTRRVAAYYVCAAKKSYIPEGHPTGGSFFVREDDITEHLNTFLNQYVFGYYRRVLLTNADLHTHAETEHTQRITALRHGITDTETKIKRLVRSLELVDEPDQDLIRDISERRTQLRDQLADLKTQLADAETEQQQQPNPTLIDALPTGDVRIDQLPEHIARDVYQALGAAGRSTTSPCMGRRSRRSGS
ncbi:recombinase family protein [Nocardia australiensis]|uniref:recombinase family protein n=1 Tax=Nocardia australiensis TaxID=2887191 RepID=UPI001D1572F5|nr:recombinase family protein [Nocardia australiensis]